MRTFINRLWILAAFSFLLGSCSDDPLTVLNPNTTVTTTVDKSEVELDKNNPVSDALTVSWEVNDYGYSAAPNYQVIIGLPGGDPSMAAAITTGQTTDKVFETTELNKILTDIGVEPETPTVVDIMVKSVLGSSTMINSELTSISVTTYADALDLSSPWGIVGSAYNDWGGDGPDAPFYKVQGEPNKYVAYVTLMDGEWKIRKDNDWAVNYGDDGGDGTLDAGGANMIATAGTYRIDFDEANLTYSIEEYSLGLVGSATPNGWDGPDTPLMYDSCTNSWKAVIKMVDGEWKIRQNNDWAVNYGSDGADGNLQDGGANIPVTLGYYQVTVSGDFLTYSIDKTDTWGVVGSGYNDWGATPDFMFTPDYCNEGVYYAYGVTLLDGEIKFRVNNDWDNNYGDLELDNILDKEDDNNIPSTAGVYDIMLDFSNPSVPVYTITSK